MSTPEPNSLQMSPVAHPPSVQFSKPQRVLACIRCQQKKIKCDRRFPCGNCNSPHVQCIPAKLTQPGRRKRRFPERELLERLRKYEDLLRQNNITFDPLHKELARFQRSPKSHVVNELDDKQVEAMSASPSASIKAEVVHEAKNFLHALHSGYRDPENENDSSDDDVRGTVVKNELNLLFADNDHLLFGSRNGNVGPSTLHPEPVQIFRLWQIYVENVNPLLKVTHTPSLQGRIVESVSNMTTISPTLEALMFSIYCMAILSLNQDDCQAFFCSSKKDLLQRFQFGCRQALLKARFLRSSDRDCLTALFLYLVSLESNTNPQSLSAMLGLAIRIAQRMGVHRESALSKFTILEAELRRRIWWSLVIFDTRISELACHQATTLAPTWDCRVPINVNDSDLRLEMKEAPTAEGKCTDAIFAVVRSELGEFVRHAIYHLEFTEPALTPISANQGGLLTEVDRLVNLDKNMEEKYLKFCDPDNPLHFMTIWWTRLCIAKCRFLELHSRSTSSHVWTEAHRDTAICHALSMLECDTKIAASPLTKGFLWFTHCYFPFPAYIQIIQELKRRPLHKQAQQAWKAMSDNCEARFPPADEEIYRDGLFPFVQIFIRPLLHAWEAREAAFHDFGEQLRIPWIVSIFKETLARITETTLCSDTKLSHGSTGMVEEPLMQMPTAYDSHSMLYGMLEQNDFDTGSGGYPNLHEQSSFFLDMNHLNWGIMDWTLANRPVSESVEFTGSSPQY